MIEFPIKNMGGSGRFCVLKRTMWPAANFKVMGCLEPQAASICVFYDFIVIKFKNEHFF